MKLETFELERNLSIWENRVRYNLSESGIHPFSLKEFLDADALDELLSMELAYCQSNGSDELREAISHLYPSATMENVLVTSGSAEANLITILTLLEPGDELIYMVPNYMQIWGFARAVGIHVKPIRLKEELNWQFDTDELKSLVTSRTRMIAVCNPNNPTGAVMSPDAVREVRNIAREADIYLLSDEVYRGAELGEEETLSMYEGDEKVIVNAGLSKAYRLPGLRIGWSIGPAEYVTQAWATHDYTTIAVSLISDRVATKVLQPQMRAKILGSARTILRENLGILQKWVDDHGNLFSFIPPQAGAIAFLRYFMGVNSTELVTRLREEKSVFIAAGDWFGMDGYVRMGLGTPREYMVTALNLIDDVLPEFE